ncbi:MAG: C40 family peptidase [Chitinophagaceae bacterium]|nr:C40 family peptidase [Chitinophagaceae bacterium]
MTRLIKIYGLWVISLLVLSCSSSKNAATASGGEIVIGNSATSSNSATSDNLKTDSIKVKYAGFLHTQPEKITNILLYKFIDYWLHTPYKWGGTDKRGIDCSAFIQKLLGDVYSIYIPRTSIDQFFANWIDRFGSTKHLSEGDLVFFRTMNDKVVSHVGVYLGNGMFVNSSSSKGVSIASLNDPYWKSKYVAAGRVKQGQQALKNKPGK